MIIIAIVIILDNEVSKNLLSISRNQSCGTGNGDKSHWEYHFCRKIGNTFACQVFKLEFLIYSFLKF